MSGHPQDPDLGRPEGDNGQDDEPAGVELTSGGDGSTFEPEEDPEGHAG
jgi:hypothetical protein